MDTRDDRNDRNRSVARLTYGLLAVTFWVLALWSILFGRSHDWPWLYAVAGAIAVIATIVTWMIWHPRMPAPGPRSPEAPGGDSAGDRRDP